MRAQNLGLSSSLVVLVYVLYNLTYAIFSTPAGIISDKLGPKKVIFVGFGIFSFVYFLFRIIKFSWFVWILFPIYGIYIALTDGVGKAYISNLVPQQKIGTAFEIYQTLIGLTIFWLLILLVYYGLIYNLLLLLFSEFLLSFWLVFWFYI